MFQRPLGTHLEKLRRAGKDLSRGFSAPIRSLLAIGIRRPGIAAAVVVGLGAEHHAPLTANRQGALPEIKAGAVKAALPRLLGW